MALAGAGLLLTSRRLHSRRMLGLVDWELLVLFMGLFIIVVQAAERRGIPISWRRHARVGVPVTLASLGIAAVSLWLGVGAP